MQFIVFFLTWNINLPAKIMLLLEILKSLVFFEFFKKMLAELTDNVECDALDGVQCTICKVHKGVASRITRLNSEGFIKNAESMIVGSVILGVVFIALGISFTIGKFSGKVK